MSNDKALNKQIFKKWWFWVVVVAILGIIGLFTQDGSNNTATNTPANNTNKQAITYSITGETLGDYGKEVVLNKDSDSPAKKYLYKLPAGTYKATTSFDKLASFFIVKDKTTLEDSDYPEVLDYVGEAHFLTAGNDDFNGKAKKEAVITLGEDESIQIVGTNSFVFEKQ